MLEKIGQKHIKEIENHCWSCSCRLCNLYWGYIEESSDDEEVAEEFDEEYEYEAVRDLI